MTQSLQNQPSHRQDIPRNASFRAGLVVWGGIGDVLLFSPVARRLAAAGGRLTLWVEDRSLAVRDLLPADWDIRPLKVQGQRRPLLAARLLHALRGDRFDLVMATGTNPLIPPILRLSGAPLRVGYALPGSQKRRRGLTHPAPLDRTVYAGQMHLALAQTALAALGYPTEGLDDPAVCRPQLAPPPQATQDWAESLLPPKALGQRVVIHPGSSRIATQKGILKGWPVDHWAHLIQQLVADGLSVTLVGGPDDADVIAGIVALLPDGWPQAPQRFVNAYGQTRSLSDLAALMYAADTVVTIDSAPMHLAVGLGRPLVALFGPTDERLLLPPAAAGDGLPPVEAVSLQGLICRPCLWAVRSRSCENPVCLGVPVPDVRQAVHRALAGRETPLERVL